MLLQRSKNKVINNRLTKREFLMLAMLLLVLEGFLLVRYVALPELEEYVSLNEANNTKSMIVERLKADYDKTETFKEELEALKQEKESIQSSIPSYVSQEEALLLLDKNSKDALLQINLIGFEAISATPGEAFIKEESKDGKNTQAVATPVITDENLEEALKIPMVINQTVSLNFAGGYNSVYSFIKSLENNLRKVYVKKLSLSSANTSILSGTMTLSFLSYVDAANYEKYTMDVMEQTGKTNPFAPYAGYGQDSKPVQAQNSADPNFYILLNSYLDNAQKIIMGEYPKAETEIYSNNNAETDCKLVVTGDSRSFGYTMTLGTVSRASVQNVQIVDGAIRLKIVSLSRKDAKDLVGMVLDIDNKTGVPLEVQILFDDNDRPRVKMGNFTGNVTVK